MTWENARHHKLLSKLTTIHLASLASKFQGSKENLAICCRYSAHW